MTEKSENNFEYILFEDLKNYINGLKKEDYGFSNILSNRIVTNATIIESKEFAILGAILKEITYEFRYYRQESELREGIKTLERLLNKYISQEYLDLMEIIKDYQDYFKKYRDIIQIDYEQYTTNIDFSLFTVRYCINFLLNEISEQSLPPKLDIIAYGILSEINRILKNTGSTPHILMLKIFLSYFSRLNEYYRYILLTEQKSTKWSENYKKIREKLISGLEKFNNDEEFLLFITELIFDICKQWRLMFMRFLELPKPRLSEKPVFVPEDIKNNLESMVSNLISSELEDEEK
ncbi:MAG: hypothetical protein GF311_01775 [Candidatus Lokiarchaeota archaeon]|nr:hypothetical protein [Candidatus Lokiarchaeota archaeon]